MSHDFDESLQQAAKSVFEDLERMESQVSGLLKRVVAEIRDNLFTPEYTMAQLMEAAGASRSTLHAFRTAFGLTPRRFIHESRMVVASRLLRDTPSSIEEICFLVGCEVSTLQRGFERWCGLYPSRFRAHAQQVKQSCLQLPHDVLSPSFWERFNQDELDDEELDAILRHFEALYGLTPEE